ncbi:MAG: aspartyl protease family protein [Chloroflexi bacterium]|nr:aspartyl protease family protein [Chloroflexota bacterium]
MGTFRHSLVLLSTDGAKTQEVEGLVDTGSSFTWVPRETLQSLGIVPSFREEFETIDGRVLEREMALVMVRLNGQTLPTLIVFGDTGTESVIGAYTLEGFRLAPDPVNRRLVHVRGLLMTAAWRAGNPKIHHHV